MKHFNRRWAELLKQYYLFQTWPKRIKCHTRFMLDKMLPDLVYITNPPTNPQCHSMRCDALQLSTAPTNGFTVSRAVSIWETCIYIAMNYLCDFFSSFTSYLHLMWQLFSHMYVAVACGSGRNTCYWRSCYCR